MKHLGFFAFIFLLSLPVQAVSRPFGLGIILGAPTGVAATYKLTQANALDFALGIDFGDNDFHFHSTYLWHFRDAINIKNYSFGWYLGAGARIMSRDDGVEGDELHLGPRGSAGLNFPLKNNQFDVFVEIALIVNIIGGGADGDGAIGGRYYF
jgi:hypothetical protein